MSDLPFESFLSPQERREWHELLRDVQENLVPKLRGSEISIVMVEEDPGVVHAMELGMSILLGIPLVVIATSGQIVPPGLERAAEAVVHLESGAMGELDQKLAPILQTIFDRGKS